LRGRSEYITAGHVIVFPSIISFPEIFIVEEYPFADIVREKLLSGEVVFGVYHSTIPLLLLISSCHLSFRAKILPLIFVFSIFVPYTLKKTLLSGSFFMKLTYVISGTSL
jgi:hypothetical protein